MYISKQEERKGRKEGEDRGKECMNMGNVSLTFYIKMYSITLDYIIVSIVYYSLTIVHPSEWLWRVVYINENVQGVKG